MRVDVGAVRRAAGEVLTAIAADPRYARSRHLLVRVGGEVVVDEHLRGPVRGDVFSVTRRCSR